MLPYSPSVSQVRDGAGPFSPLIGRFCGTAAPAALRSSSNFLWVKFLSDATTQLSGFRARGAIQKTL